MYKVLVASTTFGSVTPEPIDLLKNRDIEIIFNDTNSVLSKTQLQKLAEECDGVIAGTEMYDEETLNITKKLKVISRLGVGIDNIDLSVIKNKGIKLTTTSAHPAIAVAELVIGLIIDLLRNITFSNSNIKSEIWHKQMGSLLTGKTVGVFGLGKVGKEVIRLLQPFNVDLIVNDINLDKEFLKTYGCKQSSFEDLLSFSDVLTVHINSNFGNTTLFNIKEFTKMKRSSIFINTSRGSLVNEEHLSQAIRNKLISGAALDVFNNEPYSGNLVNQNNIILTPHIGSYAKEIRNQMEIEASKNILSVLS